MDNNCKLDIGPGSDGAYILSDMHMDLNKTRRALRKEKHKRWASMDNLYPLIMLLVFIPEAVLDIEEMTTLKELVAIVMVVMIGLNLLYVANFVLTTWSLYNKLDEQKDALSMYYYWHEQREKVLKPVVLLSFVILIDLLLGIVVNVSLWYAREHKSTVSDCLPVLTSTYVWFLANMIPFVKGWTQFKSYVWTMSRYALAMLRCQCFQNDQDSEVGRLHSWDKVTIIMTRNDKNEWVHNEHVETGNCVLEYLHLSFSPDFNVGTITYRAWTKSTWTGDYFHMWPSWTTSKTRREYKCNTHRGLLPDDFILHLLRDPFEHTDFKVHFRLDTPMQKDDLPDKITLICAA
jgi:hypothetical protein